MQSRSDESSRRVVGNGRPSNPPRLKIDTVNERYSCEHCRGVFMIVWRESATAADFLEIDRFVGDLSRAHPSGIGVLVILEPGNTRPPAAPARQALAQMTAKYKASIHGIATVLLGGTIKHSMIRFVLSTLQLMSPSEVAQETFDSIGSATTWLQTRVHGVASLDLTGNAQHLRDAGVIARKTG